MSHLPLIKNLSEELEMEKEYDWLSHVRRYIQMTYPMSLASSWAAYHTSRRAESNLLPSINDSCPYLPRRPAAHGSMPCHCFGVIQAPV